MTTSTHPGDAPGDPRSSNTPVVSLLFPTPGDRSPTPTPLELDALEDLHVEQLVSRLTRHDDGADLAELYRARPRDPAVTVYRQAVFDDLDRSEVVQTVERFATAMGRVRRLLAPTRAGSDGIEAQQGFLRAGRLYVDAAHDLATGLREATLGSSALRALRTHVEELLASSAFERLAADTDRVTSAVAGVRYRLHLAGNRLEVSRDDGSAEDYAASVARTLERFQRGDDGPSPLRRRRPGPNPLEPVILTCVAELYPEVFADLARYQATHRDLVDPTLDAVDRDARFYLAYLRLIGPLRRSGLPFCTPRLTTDRAELAVRDTCNLPLAALLVDRGKTVVRNDIELREGERVLVVTGANQGGKTTYARTIGQVLHLASLGCPVPGREATVFIPDLVLTHFARGEQLTDRRGRLQDDLVRLRSVLEVATADSLVVVNELFRSTTVADATVLGRRVLQTLLDRGLVAVFVTFLDELSTLDPAVVSLVAGVDPDDPAVRTFEVVRRAADGRAYAQALARKHGLSYEQLREAASP